MVLVGLIAVLFGAVAAGVQWDKAQWTPKLALQLEQRHEHPRRAPGDAGADGVAPGQDRDVGGWLDRRGLPVALGVPVREADGRQRPELGHPPARAAVHADRLLEPRGPAEAPH